MCTLLGRIKITISWKIALIHRGLAFNTLSKYVSPHSVCTVRNGVLVDSGVLQGCLLLIYIFFIIQIPKVLCCSYFQCCLSLATDVKIREKFGNCRGISYFLMFKFYDGSRVIAKYRNTYFVYACVDAFVCITCLQNKRIYLYINLPIIYFPKFLFLRYKVHQDETVW